MSKRGGFGKILTGAAIGLGLGFLFAPKTGEETRKELKAKLDEMINRVRNMDAGEVKLQIENKVAEIKKELEELDKEKVLEIAKRKSKELQEKANDLVEYAVQKGTPILEKTAAVIREKTLSVTKEIVKKLEDSEPEKATPITEVKATKKVEK